MVENYPLPEEQEGEASLGESAGRQEFYFLGSFRSRKYEHLWQMDRNLRIKALYAGLRV